MSDQHDLLQTTETFTYSPLPSASSIRLLHPQGGSSVDKLLHFSLRTHDLDKPDPSSRYHCLSYTWGNPFAHGVPFADHYRVKEDDYGPKKRAPIVVDGKIIHIQRNLLDALETVPHIAYESHPERSIEQQSEAESQETLKSAKEGIYIWADAICINQNDIDEKNVQVSMMDRIYSNASYVLAWLGPEDSHTEAGLRAVSTLSTHLTAFDESKIQPYSGRDKLNYDDAGIALVSKEEWDGLASIFQRQWFRRAWIVQEAVLPPTLIMYCGKHLLKCADLGAIAQSLRFMEAKLGTYGSTNYVPQEEIAIAVEWNMAEMAKWRNHMYQTSHSAPEERQAYRDLFSLRDLVADFWTFRATDPKDKIFSLNGLLNVFTEERSVADYRSSVASVYTDAARRIIRETKSLEILTSQVSIGERIAGLPSWVPDFSIPGVNHMPEFDTAKGLAFEEDSQGEVDNTRLEVRGFRVGTIQQAPGRISMAPEGKHMLDPSWFKMLLSLRQSHQIEEGHEPLSEILWKTLCMNTPINGYLYRERFEEEESEEMRRQFTVFMMLIILAGADQKVLESVGLKAGSHLYPHTVIHTPHDPWKEDLAGLLNDLDAVLEHDGENCLIPMREEILMYWDHIKYTLMRTTAATKNADGTVDITAPSNVLDGTDRLVGKGVVNIGSLVYQTCQEFGASFHAAYGGRQMVTVDDRYLGLAPTTAQEGDEIWILAGLKNPMVLRRTANLGCSEHLASALDQMKLDEIAPQYQLVGTGYVHGIMNGEAVEDGMNHVQSIVLV